MDDEARSDSLLAFFGLTFLGTWTFFLSARWLSGAVQSTVILAGVFVPAVVAICLTAVSEGSQGVGVLLRRLVQWEAAPRWYAFAVTYMVAIKLTVAVVHRAIAGAWPRFGVEPWYVMLAATILSVAVGGQAGEEIGWRGFALPRLARRFGFGGAGVILGVVWAVWHLPLFFLPASNTNGQSFIIYVLQVTAVSVAMTWLYMNTGGSLLLAMLMHSAINQTKDIVPSALPGASTVFTLNGSLVEWLTVSMLWLIGAVLLALEARTSSQIRGMERRRLAGAP